MDRPLAKMNEHATTQYNIDKEAETAKAAASLRKLSKGKIDAHQDGERAQLMMGEHIMEHEDDGSEAGLCRSAQATPASSRSQPTRAEIFKTRESTASHITSASTCNQGKSRMGVRDIITRARIAGRFMIKGEGEYHPGPWQLPVTGGWLPAGVGENANWWQMGYNPSFSPESAMVEACVSAYSQTVAMCPGDHWRMNDKGGRDRIGMSSISRVLRKPNSYQSISDFLLNATRQLYTDGSTTTGNCVMIAYEIGSYALFNA